MNIHTGVKVAFRFELTLTETEARALRQLTKYSLTDFINFYNKSLGKFPEKHENGLAYLFKAVKENLSPQLEAVDGATKTLNRLAQKEEETK